MTTSYDFYQQDCSFLAFLILLLALLRETKEQMNSLQRMEFTHFCQYICIFVVSFDTFQIT